MSKLVASFIKISHRWERPLFETFSHRIKAICVVGIGYILIKIPEAFGRLLERFIIEQIKIILMALVECCNWL